jgi:hypothetical protein
MLTATNSPLHPSITAYFALHTTQSFLDGSAAPGVEQAPSNNVLMLVSHDFNQFYLQRLLGLNYFSYGFPENVATTAGSLRFDLYQDAEQVCQCD